MPMSESSLAILSALVGGIITQIVAWFISRDKNRNDNTKTVFETREKDLGALRGRVDKLEAELERWRNLYYELREENQKQALVIETMRLQLEALNQSDTE
jgi:hypothetical protein